MNLIAQLNAAAAYVPPVPEKKGNLENLRYGYLGQYNKALSRYREAMYGNGWLTQTQIEHKLGYAATVASHFLKRMMEEGRVIRRNRNDAPTYCRKFGYEYLWLLDK